MEMEERWKKELADRIYDHTESAIIECYERLEGLKVENVKEYKALVDLVLRKAVRKYGETDKDIIKDLIECDLETVAENGGLWRSFTAIDEDGNEYIDRVLEDPPQKQKPTLNHNTLTTTAVIEHHNNGKSSPVKQLSTSTVKQTPSAPTRLPPSSPADKKTGVNPQNEVNRANAAKNTNPDMSITVEDADDEAVEAASPQPKKLKQTKLTLSHTKRTVNENPKMERKY